MSQRRQRRSHRAAALALVALSSTAGCSWFLIQPPREDRSPSESPVCSTDLTPPVIDTGLFILNAGTTIYLAVPDDVSHKALRASVGATAAALWLLSAVYGYVETSACTAAIESHQHDYRRPAIGTGGEIFLQQEPPPQPSPPPQRPDGG